MNVYSDGKTIPTYQFGELFVQGEKFADTVTFVLDRYYGGSDLLEYSFCIRGETEDGWEAQQVLTPIPSGSDKLVLSWNVSDSFTYNAGKLLLELRASSGENVILKYAMPPVTVRPTPSGRNGPLPETSEQLISQLTAIVDEGETELRQMMDSFNLDEISARLDAMDANIAVFLARPEVIPMTMSQYQTSQHKQNSLYVIIDEEEE